MVMSTRAQFALQPGHGGKRLIGRQKVERPALLDQVWSTACLRICPGLHLARFAKRLIEADRLAQDHALGPVDDEAGRKTLAQISVER